MVVSSGIILYRRKHDCEYSTDLEYLMCHPGGPYHKNNDTWYFPKGGVEEIDKDDNGDELMTYRNTAIREFEEEVGIRIPDNVRLRYLGSVKQRANKRVHAFGCDYTLLEPFDLEDCESNIITIEHPSKSGKFIEIPEIDKYRWMDFWEVKEKTHKKHINFFIETWGDCQNYMENEDCKKY